MHPTNRGLVGRQLAPSKHGDSKQQYVGKAWKSGLQRWMIEQKRAQKNKTMLSQSQTSAMNDACIYIYRCMFFGAIFGKSLGTDVGMVYMVSGLPHCNHWNHPAPLWLLPDLRSTSERSFHPLPSTEWNAFSFWCKKLGRFFWNHWVPMYLWNPVGFFRSDHQNSSDTSSVSGCFRSQCVGQGLKATLQEPLMVNLVNLKMYENVPSGNLT